MKKGEKFSPERLLKNRRMRKARRLFKRMPLFAFEEMTKELPDYAYAEFLDDLRRRSPRKKRQPKNQLIRYGRYRRMENMMHQYRETGDLKYAIEAKKLRLYMTKHYRIMVKIQGCCHEYFMSPLIPIEQIEELVGKLGRCQTATEAEEAVDNFHKSTYYGQ